MVNFTARPLHPRGRSPQYSFSRTLGGLQSRSGRCEEEKVESNLCSSVAHTVAWSQYQLSSKYLEFDLWDQQIFYVSASQSLCPRPKIWSHICLSRSRDSAVGIATGYRLDDEGVGVRVPVGTRNFTSPCRPDRLWGSHNLLSNVYRGLFHRE
jgi:hypothetical protein